MGSRRMAVASAALLACVASCSNNEDTGVLGNGAFRYLCSSESTDEACTGASDVDLPAALAVGASFQIAYSPNSSSSGGVVEGVTGYEIIAASPEFATTTGDTIAAQREGLVALLAEHVGKSTVDDFIHLRFSTIARLKPSDSQGRPLPLPVSLGPGESMVVTVEPFDVNAAKLYGQIPCAWYAPGGSPVTVDPNATSRSASVQGVGGGTGTVHVTCASAVVDIPFTVSGPPLADGGTNG
ncbi:MAG TPA: hypothetical protein VKU41_30455 [Polyangiaceae bacterium]|nr:hypothetical protein [Polyangiaceae bacterium]